MAQMGGKVGRGSPYFLLLPLLLYFLLLLFFSSSFFLCCCMAQIGREVGKKSHCFLLLPSLPLLLCCCYWWQWWSWCCCWLWRWWSWWRHQHSPLTSEPSFFNLPMLPEALQEYCRSLSLGQNSWGTQPQELNRCQALLTWATIAGMPITELVNQSDKSLLYHIAGSHGSIWHMTIDNSGDNLPDKWFSDRDNPVSKVCRTTDSENCLLVSVISLICHCISFLRTTLSAFPLFIRLSHVNITSIGHKYSCEWSGRWFLLNCLISMNKKILGYFTWLKVT